MRRVLIYLTLLAVIAWHYEANAAQLFVSWTDNSKDEKGFRIERREGRRGKFEEIATVGPNLTSYTDASAQVGRTYCYRVRAFNSFGNSAYSQEVCATAGSGKASKSKAIIGSYEVIRFTPVYSQPRGDSQRVATILEGTKVQVVDIQGDWLEIRSKHGRPPGFIRKGSTVPKEEPKGVATVAKEGPKGVAIIKISSGDLLGLFLRSPKISILSVDGKKVAESEAVEVSSGLHVIGIECIGSPELFSSTKIKSTFNYDLQAKGGHTYQISGELVGGLCKVWIDETRNEEASSTTTDQ